MANLPHRLGLLSSPTPCYPAADFNDCMNTVHQRVQFTWEEKERWCVMTTKIYRKPSYTNIGLKPQSCQDPKTATASFKGELCLCYRLCSSLELTKNEVEFTLNLFEDNGHNREKQTHHRQLQTIDHQRQGQQNKNKKTKTPLTTTEIKDKALFSIVPFVGTDLTENYEPCSLFVCLPLTLLFLIVSFRYWWCENTHQ